MYRWSVYIAFLVLVTALCCRRNQAPDVLPSSPETDTLSPKIVSMYVPGIPLANVQIDQKQRQIIVTVPKAYPVSSKEGVTFTLTPDARWVRGLNFVPNTIGFCDSRLYRSTPGYMTPVTTEDLEYDPDDILIRNDKRKKTYRLVVKPEGDMAFSTNDPAYEVTTGWPHYSIPRQVVYNYIDGEKESSTNAKSIFIHESTGEQQISYALGCSDSGKVYISLPHLRLGSHAVYIQKANGRKTTNSLRLTVKAGVPNYYGFSYVLTGNRSQGIIASTESMFEGADYEVEIWHRRTGERYRVKPVQISPYGTQIRLPVPTTLKAGYYYTRLYVDGKPFKIGTATIQQDADQPVIWDLQTPDTYIRALHSLTEETIPIRRGKVHWLMFHPQRRVPMQVHLQSAVQPDKTYTFNVIVPDSFGSDPGMMHKPSFVPPNNIPPGRYLFRLQYKKEDGGTAIGEPLERDVLVE